MKIVFLLAFITAVELFPTELFSQELANRAIDTAISYNKTTEIYYNGGGDVSRFIKYGGGKDGYSWCLYFVYYSFGKASTAMKIKNPLKRTGACWNQLKYAASSFSKLKVIPQNMFRVAKANRGDIAIFKSGKITENYIGSQWAGHTGIFLEKINEKRWRLIEGNTNIKGSREGGKKSKDGVFIKDRNPYTNNFQIIALIRV